MPYGLKKETIVKINQIFERYQQVDKVFLYGSRAKGTYKNGSDIDLTLFGKNLNLKLLNKISIDLDDLLLPYKIDLSIYDQITNIDLINHILRVKLVFYKKPREF